MERTGDVLCLPSSARHEGDFKSKLLFTTKCHIENSVNFSKFVQHDFMNTLI